MAARGWFSGLRFRLLLLVTLAVVPALGLALQSGLNDRQAALDGAHAETMSLALLTASSNSRLVDETHQILAGLAQIPAVQNSEPGACSDLLSAVMRNSPLFSDVAVLQLDGTVSCSARPIQDHLNFGGRRFFQQVVSTGAFSAGEYGFSSSSGVGALMAGYPLMDDTGHVHAVLHASLDLTWLSRLAVDMRFPSTVKMIVFDRDATIWLQYPLVGPAVGPVTGAGSVRRQLASVPEGTGEYLGLEGTQYVYAYAPLSDGSSEPSAFVSLSVDRDQILASANA